MSSKDAPGGRCGFVLEPEDVHGSEPNWYDAESDEWYDYSDAVCCWREVWDGGDGDRCIWHAETDAKSAATLTEARDEGPERLDGAYVPAIELGDAIDFDGCRLWAITFEGTDLRRSSFRQVDGWFARFHNASLGDAQFSDAFLWDAKFHETDLREAQFRDADLYRAQFRNADLKNTRFPDAELYRTQFRDADLEGGQFHHANLRWARFLNTNLSGAQFHDAELWEAEFPNANLSGAQFPDAFLWDAQFPNANLTEAQFPDADLWDAQFPDANLSSARFPDAHIRGAQFPGADLYGAQFRDAFLRRAQFHDAYLWEAKLPDANLYRAQFPDAYLKGADLTNVDATDATFTNATLEAATLRDADLGDADLTDARLHDAHLLNVRINEGTEFDSVIPEEANIGWFNGPTLAIRVRLRWWLTLMRMNDQDRSERREQLDKANTVYRTIQRLYRENSMPRRIDTYYVRARDTRRKQAILAVAPFRWLYLAGQRWVMGYGERPLRVVATSLAVVGLSTLLYPLWGLAVGKATGPPPRVIGYPFDGVGLVTGLGKSLYLSVITFTTLGYGDVQPLGHGEALATLESLVGAFLMALLVYVLGRRATQ